MNPKNVLHYKANFADCKLKTSSVSAYWIMGEEDGQTEGLTSKEKPYFNPQNAYENDTDADFTLGAIEKMGSNLPDKNIRVRLENCVPKAFLELKGLEIQLTEIYVSVNMFMSVKYMTITGIAPNGEKVKIKIEN